jgi:hypothetical protein
MGDSPGGVAQASANAAAYVAQTQPQVNAAAAAAAAATQAATQAAASADAAAQSLIQLKAQILLPTISPDVANELAGLYPATPIHQISAYPMPSHPLAIAAGTKALANQLTLEYQAGTISLAQLNTAIAQLTTAANTPG